MLWWRSSCHCPLFKREIRLWTALVMSPFLPRSSEDWGWREGIEVNSMRSPRAKKLIAATSRLVPLRCRIAAMHGEVVPGTDWQQGVDMFEPRELAHGYRKIMCAGSRSEDT
eukprot:12068646-Karenia_brevis.AAC.1